MNGPEHYRTAEALMALAPGLERQELLARAKVHALLALAAASAYASFKAMTVDERERWNSALEPRAEELPAGKYERDDPETGAPLPPGVDGFRAGGRR